MTAARVLVADQLSEAGLRLLKDRGLSVEVRTGLGEADLAKAVEGCEALIVRSATKVTEKVLASARRLKVVGRAGVGVDNIDEAAATRHGILVMNTPLGNTMAAAEHTMALILALSRNVPQAVSSLKGGAWERTKFAGIELAEKSLGVIGLGKIGREVAFRARAFQMKVLAHDPFVSQEAAHAIGVELVTMEDLLSRSDFVTLHTPLNVETEGLLGAAQLALMKPSARLINVARGGLVDETALADALRNGRLAGAALDVFATEPPTGSPLLGLPNLIATPHLGASTVEAQEKVSTQVAEQIADYLLEGKVRNATNLTYPPDPALLPFLRLAEAMGSFAVQLSDGQPSTLTVECRGELARLDTRPVAVAALVGILGRASDERVNFVNAEQKAKAFGIRFVLTQSEAVEDYTASLRVTLATDRDEVGLLGTHLARLGGRIVEINGYDVEFKPTGRFLVIPHRDQPGTIAKISSVLGRENVNIAQMVVGRLSPRGEAISILRVDDPIPQKALDEIRTVLKTPAARTVEVLVSAFGTPDKDATIPTKNLYRATSQTTR